MKKFSLIILCFAISVFSLIATNKLESHFEASRPIASAIFGLVFSGLFFYGLIRLYDATGVKQNYTHWNYKDISISFGITLLVFASSIALLLLEGHSFTHFNGAKFLDFLLYQIRPATIEEVGFRFGIVTIAVFYFNLNVGILLGAIPFGVLHLLNFLSGGEIYWLYILGTGVAGIFLSVIYLRFGLYAAVLVHYVWNVLASTAASSSSFKQEQLEGGVGTLAILLIASMVIFLDLRKSSTNKRNK